MMQMEKLKLNLKNEKGYFSVKKNAKKCKVLKA
jgi:hypothetical protein